jgi:hypothetical protein
MLSAMSLATTAWALSGAVCADASEVGFERREHSVVVRIGDQPVATYVFQDRQVQRPYMAHVRTRSGKQVTRNHPPQEGVDAMDHARLHPGIALSFGDLSGCDYWRLKARTEHVRFVEEPRTSGGTGTFGVLNRYWSTDAATAIAQEECYLRVVVLPEGFRIEWTSSFAPLGEQIVFGDQEEMGLGLRLATPLAVNQQRGGRMLDSRGRRNEEQIWGRTVEWVDCSGPVDGAWVGITGMASPDNFRPCWAHARDYGFVGLNPFGRKAFTGEDESRVVVRRGETLTLHYAVVVHESRTEGDVDLDRLYKDFVAAARRER